jgi:energy-converting hydrogenase Eha subunit H
VTFAIIYITAAVSYSVIAPFYPTEVSAWRSEEAAAYWKIFLTELSNFLRNGRQR